MANTNLKEAKAAKNDEFYTQFHDIEIEMNAYLEYDPDVFRGKTVLLPCDDPEWSNFTRYFAAKFDELGLKKLISTSYAPDSKKYKTPYQPSLFEQEAPQFDPSKAQVKGKIFILERDKSGDGRINIDDLEWKYMDGDGDFRSKEVTELRNEADFIINDAAKRQLDKLGAPKQLPKRKDVIAEIQSLVSQKNECYNDYREKSDRLHELMTMQRNYQMSMPQPKRGHSHEQER
jgi:hypothetical protein